MSVPSQSDQELYDEDLANDNDFSPQQQSSSSSSSPTEDNDKMSYQQQSSSSSSSTQQQQHVKGPWTTEEDNLLRLLVEKYGTKHWSIIANYLPRTGKQCRERWCNYLNPNINKGAWTQEEESIIIATQARIGNKWAEIAKLLPGRTDNSVKNHWNSMIRKRMRENDKILREEDGGDLDAMSFDQTSGDDEPMSKRLKTEHLSASPSNISSVPQLVTVVSPTTIQQQQQLQQQQQQMPPTSVFNTVMNGGGTTSTQPRQQQQQQQAPQQMQQQPIFFVPSMDPNNPTGYYPMYAPFLVPQQQQQVQQQQNRSAFPMMNGGASPQMMNPMRSVFMAPPQMFQQAPAMNQQVATSTGTTGAAGKLDFKFGPPMMPGTMAAFVPPNNGTMQMTEHMHVPTTIAPPQLAARSLRDQLPKMKTRYSGTAFTGGIVVEKKSQCLMKDLGISVVPTGISGTMQVTLGNDQFSMSISRNENHLKVFRAYTKKSEDKSDKNLNKKGNEATNNKSDNNSNGNRDEREYGIVIRIEPMYANKPLMYIPMVGRVMDLSLTIDNLGITSGKSPMDIPPATDATTANTPPKASSILVMKDRQDPLFKRPFATSFNGAKYDLRFSLNLTGKSSEFFVALRDPVFYTNNVFLRCSKIEEFPELSAVNSIEYFMSYESLK